MTTPPGDPATTPQPGLSTSLTEPVPAYVAAVAPVEPGPGSTAASDPAALAASPKRSSSGSSRIVNLALGAAVLVAVAGVAFAVGRTTAPAAQGTARVVDGNGFGAGPDASFLPRGNGSPGGGDQPGGFPGNGTGGRGGFGGLGGLGAGLLVEGTVDSVTGDSVTIKTTDGTTVTVGLDAATTYHQQAAASSSEVSAGDSVKLQITGGFRLDRNAPAGGTPSLGTASDVTVVP